MGVQAERQPAPLFSVIVPVYNTEPYLGKCVGSIRGQTYRDFELILVDNGSPDGCPAICDGYARRDGRVRVIHKEHGSITSARNAGLAAARGIYACYVDSDDWVESTYLETVARYAEEFSRPDIILFGAIEEFKTRSERMNLFTADGYYSRNRLEREILPYMIIDRKLPNLRGREMQAQRNKAFKQGGGVVAQAPWNKVFKRELLEEHCCRDERISQAEDLTFTYECMYFANSAYFCQDDLYHYSRMNPSAETRKYCENLLEQYQWVYDYVKKRLGGRDPELDAQIRLLQGFFLIKAVLNEARHSTDIWSGARQIRKNIGQSRMVRECPLGALFRSKAFLLPLKLRCYHLAWLRARMRLQHEEG